MPAPRNSDSVHDLAAMVWGAWLAAASGRQLHIDSDMLGPLTAAGGRSLHSVHAIARLQAVAQACPAGRPRLSQAHQEIEQFTHAGQCNAQHLLSDTLASPARVVSLRTDCLGGMQLPPSPPLSTAAEAIASHCWTRSSENAKQHVIRTQQDVLPLQNAFQDAVQRRTVRPNVSVAVDSAGGFTSAGQLDRCIPLLLHAAWSVQDPANTHVLNSLAAFHEEWAAYYAPAGYRVLQAHVGDSWLYLNAQCTLGARGQEPEHVPMHHTSTAGDAWLDFAQAAADSSQPTGGVPLLLLSDSQVLKTEVATRLWDTHTVLHCCTFGQSGVMPAQQPPTDPPRQDDNPQRHDTAPAKQLAFDLIATSRSSMAVHQGGLLMHMGMHWLQWGRRSFGVVWEGAGAVPAAGEVVLNTPSAL